MNAHTVTYPPLLCSFLSAFGSALTSLQLSMTDVIDIARGDPNQFGAAIPLLHSSRQIKAVQVQDRDYTVCEDFQKTQSNSAGSCCSVDFIFFILPYTVITVVLSWVGMIWWIWWGHINMRTTKRETMMLLLGSLIFCGSRHFTQVWKLI